MMDPTYAVLALSTLGSSLHAHYALPVVLVGVLALWFLPGLLARAAGRLIYSFAKKLVTGAASASDVVFERTSEGFHLRNFSTNSTGLRLYNGPFEVGRLAVAEAHLVWPSWQHRVLQLRATGVRLELLQRQMPRARSTQPGPAGSQQLVLLEQLLWQGDGAGRKSAGGRWSWLRQWAVKAALGLVDLQLDDCRCQYVVHGQLGPSRQQQLQEQRDGIAVSIRRIVISPHVARATAASNSDAHVVAAVAEEVVPPVKQRSTAPSPMTQMTVTGVSIAVMSSQLTGPSVAVERRATMQSGGGARSPVNSDLAGCLAGEGWAQAHVLLKQWQCSIHVHSHAYDKATAAEEAACLKQDDALWQLPQPPAILLKFNKSAGVSEIDKSTFDRRSQANVPATGNDNRTKQEPTRGLYASVEMKSLVLVVAPNAMAIASRVLTMYSQYQLLSPVWSERPSQQVSSAPAVWWQHAANTVLAECRRRLPPRSIRQALDRRRKYIALYQALHIQQPGYKTGGRKQAVPHLSVGAAGQALKEAESTMTVCEIATHRIFVALLHSRFLHQHPALRQQWLEALDGLGGFVDLIPPGNHMGASTGLAISLQCPAVAVKLVSSQQLQTAQLIAEMKGLQVAMPAAGTAALTVQQVQVLLNNTSASTTPSSTRGGSGSQGASHVQPDASEAAYTGHVPVLQLPKMDGMAESCSTSQGIYNQQGTGRDAPFSAPRPSSLGRIYSESLINTYISRLQVQLGPIMLHLRPQLALQALDYIKAVRAFQMMESSTADSSADKVVSIKRMVLDSFKRNRVPLSFALSALLPVTDVSCPQLAVVAPLTHVQQLDGNTTEQAPPGTAVEVVARLQKLHASVGYNSSCYSSLLQQVDATADAEVFFVQRAPSSVASQQQLAHYAALWMHPDDVAQLDPMQYSPAAAAAARKSIIGLGTSSTSGLRASVMGLFGSGAAPPGPATSPLLVATQPFVPLVKLQRVWGRLSTHIPTEPAVLGGEHTTAGCSAAGLLLWMSPWQVKLITAAVDQLAEDGLVMWQRMQSSFSQTVSPSDVLAAAGDAAAAAATDMAISEAQEAGGGAAAASKVATAYVQAAGALVQADATAADTAAAPGQKKAAMQHASRKAAEQASLSLMMMLPYCEVICFADLGCEALQTSNQGDKAHRYKIKPAPFVQTITQSNKTAQQDQHRQQVSLLQHWGTRIAPVASLVFCGLRAGTTTGADGALAAKLHVSSLLVVNLQLLDLCKTQATMPSAAGVYLPAGHVVPAWGERSRVSTAHSQYYRILTADPTTTAAAAVATDAAEVGCGVVHLSANHNAFVLSPFTPRLTAAYQSATLSRWRLLGLSRLAIAAGACYPAASGAAPPGCIARGRVKRGLLMQQRWQAVLELRAFARSLDYAMFLLFRQDKEKQKQQQLVAFQLAGRDSAASASPFEQYQLLYRYSLPEYGVTVAAQDRCHPKPHTGWFGSRRSSRASSYTGSLPISAGTERKGAGPAANMQPGSPCNWRNAGFSWSLLHKLAADEVAEGATSSRLATLDSSVYPAKQLSPEQLRFLRTRRASEPTAASSRGVPASSSTVLQHNGTGQAHTALYGQATKTSSSTAVGKGEDNQPSHGTPRVSGMQIFSALSNLRSGSANLLSSAAQQLRLRQRKQKEQQTAIRRTSCLGDTSKSSHGLYNNLLPGEGASQSKASLYGDSRPVANSSQLLWQQQQAEADMASLEYSLVDFLDRFAGSFMAVNLDSSIAYCQSSIRDVPVRTYSSGITSPGTPLGTPTAAGNWARRTPKLRGLQQNHIAVAYTQQPAYKQQVAQGYSRSALPADADSLQDTLTVSLAHVKAALGPHTVSMLLQLMTCITPAASGRKASSMPAAQQHSDQHSRPASKAVTGVRPRGIRVQLEMAVLHVKLNMERPPGLDGSSLTRGRYGKDLETQEVLSLQLLGTAATVDKVPDVPDAAAIGSNLRGSLEVSCSVEHIGLQDLCACVEQRHVLSGASSPLKASTDPESSSSPQQQSSAACTVSAQVLSPAGGGTPEQPTLLTLSIINPRLMLVRRFVNNALYVVTLVNHEVEAAGSFQKGNTVPVVPSANAEASKASTAVVLLSLRNVQVVMPRSHACKTLADKYAAAAAKHTAAKANAHQKQQQDGEHVPNCCCSCDTDADSGTSCKTGDSAGSTCGNSTAAQRPSPRLSNSSTAADRLCSQDGPWHAYHPEVVVLQVGCITVAAPAEPALLQLAHGEVPGDPQPHAGGTPPLWMREPAAVQQLVANSRAILLSSGAQAAVSTNAQQQQQQQQGVGADGFSRNSAGAQMVAVGPAVCSPPTVSPNQTQAQQVPSEQPPAQFTSGRRNKPAAAVRHGVLMLSESNAATDEEVDAASPLPRLNLTQAASRYWKQFVAKVAPRRRRTLVIRPDGQAATATAGGTGTITTTAGPVAAGSRKPGFGQRVVAAAVAVAGAAGGGGDDEAPAAHCLVDFQGFELFAGKMQRFEDLVTQDGSAFSVALARWQAGLQSIHGLRDLTHLIPSTSLQAAVHEHLTPTTTVSAARPAANVLALAAPDGLALHLSATSYRCLMDMVSGNLLLRGNSFEKGQVPADASANHQTHFDPGLKFGPKPGQLPSFGITLNSPTIQGNLFADQRWWTVTGNGRQQQCVNSGAGRGNSHSGGGTTVVEQFVSASLQNAALCIQMMQSTMDMHINLWSADTEWLDVRMANTAAGCSPEQELSKHQERSYFMGSTEHSGIGIGHDSKGDNTPFAAPAATWSAGVSAEVRANHRRTVGNYSSANALLDVQDKVCTAALPEDTALPDMDAVHESRIRRRPPATASPAHLHSARISRHAPQAGVEEDELGSAQGVSSDEAVGEQQLGTFELYPALLQPSGDGADKGAGVSIIRSLDELPVEESAHLSNKGKRARAPYGHQPDYCPMNSAGFKLHFGYLKDGTMTIELVLAHTLLQWPYLTDLSLVSAIVNIFNSAWGAAPMLPPAWLQLRRNPWLYFNLVITDSQIVLPLLTPHVDTSSTSEQEVLRPFNILQNVVMRQASGLTAADIDGGRGQPLEQLGLALTFGAFRFAYFYGGDGEAITRFDVRNMAGFIRDRTAVITSWLLPLPSAKLELRQAWPLVEEHTALKVVQRFCRKLQLNYKLRKRHKLKKLANKRNQQMAGANVDEDADSELQLPTSGMDKDGKILGGKDNTSGSYATSATRSASAAAIAPEQRLLALACEHAEEITGERVTADWHNTWARHGHSQPAQASGLFGQSSSGMFGVYKRKARSELLVVMSPVTLRAAFSNIRTWKILQSDLALAGKSMSSGLGMWPPRPDIQTEVLSIRRAGGTWPPAPTGWAAEFRRSSLRCTVDVAAIMLMLCDDKPQSFGAPDVLQAVAKGVSLVHAVETRFPRVAPERADKVHVEGGIGVNILNNSNSKWEVMLEPWPLLLSLCDPINPLAKADRTLYGQALSSEPMRINFHPSSLLSIGDLLAFIRELTAAPNGAESQHLQQAASQSDFMATISLAQQEDDLGVDVLPAKRAPMAQVTEPRGAEVLRQAEQAARRPVHNEAPPSIEQQMALAEGVTSRIPQRYLIQNLCGSHLWYWSCEEEGGSGSSKLAKRRVLLPAHSMQELKVNPTLRQVRQVAADGSLLSTGLANAISIQLAGNWLPLEDVAVDVVGKYRYEVRNPLGGPSLPLVLDVLLVGRTKMLRLHSCIWLENRCSMKLEPCIQLGTACSTPVVLGPGDKFDSLQRLHLKPLKPKEGRFLPAAAALGGTLFLVPEGYLSADHDVLQLKTSLLALKQQQGYISCPPKPDGIQLGALHLAATIHLGVQSDNYFTTQNLVEVPRHGTLRRARLPLEATIHISPTMQLTNGLPYDVLGWALVSPGRELGRTSLSLQPASSTKTDNATSGKASWVKWLHRKEDPASGRASLTGAPSLAQAAITAAGSSPALQSASLQQVWQAGNIHEASIALSRVVAAAGSAEQALKQSTVSQQLSGPVAGNGSPERARRSSWFVGGAADGDAHSTSGDTFRSRTVQQGQARAGRNSVVGGTSLSQRLPERGASGGAGGLQDKVLQLSEACELLLMQRWCRDLVLEEFVKTLHLVLSPATAAAVDVPALWLLDLPSLVALAIGVVAEEFGWIAKAFPQAFNLILKTMEAMRTASSTGTASPNNGSNEPVSQMPWPDNQLPVVELLSLLHWLQQYVVRLELAPGGSADLYMDPDLEVYTAVRVPLLAMESRPTLISSGKLGLGGSDTLRLSYSKNLDVRHSMQQQTNGNSMQGLDISLAGKPRLGSVGLQVLTKPETVHAETRARMTSTAMQLAELASRKKVTHLPALLPSQQLPFALQQQFSRAATPPPGSYVHSMSSSSRSPKAAVRSGTGALPQPYTWSMEPALPMSSTAALVSYGQYSYAELDGSAQAEAEAATASQAALLPWFAVVVELLGDVVRLSIHEADYYAPSDSREQQNRPAFNPRELLDDLLDADEALTSLGKALQQQAVQAATAAVCSGTSDLPPGVDSNFQRQAQLRSSSSNSNLAEAESDEQASVSKTVDVPATMDAVCRLLMYPPQEIDRLFMKMVIDREHPYILTDQDMAHLLRFSCKALVDNIIIIDAPEPIASGPAATASTTSAPAPSATHPMTSGSASMQESPAGSLSKLGSRQAALTAPQAGGSSLSSPSRLLSSPSYSSSVPGSAVASCNGKQRLSRLQQPTWQSNPAFSPTYQSNSSMRHAFAAGDDADSRPCRGMTAEDADLSSCPAPLPPTPCAEREPPMDRDSPQQLQQQHAPVDSREWPGSGGQESWEQIDLEQAEMAEGDTGTPPVLNAGQPWAAQAAARQTELGAAALTPLKGLKSLRTLIIPPPAAQHDERHLYASDAAEAAARLAFEDSRSRQQHGTGQLQPQSSIDRHNHAAMNLQGSTSSSSDTDGDNSADEGLVSPLSRRQGGSFRRRPGASVKQLAKHIRHASGAPAKLVQESLSTHLARALERRMQAMAPATGVDRPAGVPVEGSPSWRRRHMPSMSLQALGLGAMAADISEGQPGFCAPATLQVSLLHSGGRLSSNSKSNKAPSNGSSGKPSIAGADSAAQHILLSASFWLDNRSGVNLVLSDLDRRWVKGLPGSGLPKLRDVHSPGLPRDCAATEADEPELSSLFGNAAKAVSSCGGSAAEAANLVPEMAADGAPAAGSSACESDLDRALSRLQEVRPALLNDQSWLRFWVEEHMVIPSQAPGGKNTRCRPSTFRSRPASLFSGMSTPFVDAAAAAVGGVVGAASAFGSVQSVRSEPSGFFKIAVTGSKTDIKVKGRKCRAELAVVQDTPSPQEQLIGMSSSGMWHSSNGGTGAGVAYHSRGMQGLAARRAVGVSWQQDQQQTTGCYVPCSEASAGDDSVDGRFLDPPVAEEVSVQRLFEFAAEVWPTPAEGPFRATKVVSIKSKYILFNDTGMVLEYKQKGTPDPGHPGYVSYGKGRRFAGQLQPQERCAFHWDNIDEARLLVIRPAAPGWPWSGAFPLPEREDYFGIRLRHRWNVSAMIIPVNSTVGRSGSVLITFKSTSSVPPYRVENRTKSVMVMLRQQLGDKTAAPTGGHGTSGPGRPTSGGSMKPLRRDPSPRATTDVPAGWAWDSLAPGSSIPFAWDDYTGRHSLEVAAAVLAAGGKTAHDTLVSGKKNMYSFDLDNFKSDSKDPPFIELKGNMRSVRSTLTAGSDAATQAAATALEPQLSDASCRQQLSSANTQPAMSARMVHPAAGMFVPTQTAMVAQQSDSHLRAASGMGQYGAGADREVRTRLDGSSATGEGGKAINGSGAVFDKKVYVSLYADGPTQVLCFSDSPLAGSTADEEGGTQKLISRLHQVARQLMQIERQLGSAYNMRMARGSRPVPAMLLLQHLQQKQQQNTAAGGADAELESNLPVALHGQGTAWHTAGTTTAAVALLQQMSRQQVQAADAESASLMGSMPNASGTWAIPEAAGGLSGGRYLSETDAQQASYANGGPTFRTASPSGGITRRAEQQQQSQQRQSQVNPGASLVSGSTLASAAAAANDGVRISDGLVTVDGVDRGLRLYYDKLTLLLDSGLPLGGNCKVKLQAGRSLMSAGMSERLRGCQARLGVPGQHVVLTGLAERTRDSESITWNYEELFTEVTALSELVVEIWGVPSAGMFPGRLGSTQSHPNSSRGQHSNGAAGHQAGSGLIRRAGDVTANGNIYGSQTSLASGSIFLGSVNIPLMHTLPGVLNGGRHTNWYSLMRRTGDQHVTGQVQLDFSWSFTRETLLACELRELEKLLASRQEVLAKLSPLNSTRVARLMGVPSVELAVGDAGRGSPAAAVLGAHSEEDDWEGSTASDDTGESSLLTATSPAGVGTATQLSPPHSAQQQPRHSQRTSIISCRNVFSGLDLGMADSSVVTLEVGVIEVANLSPRSGWSQDLTHALLSSAAVGSAMRQNNAGGRMMLSEAVKKSELPLPVVYVFCGSGGPQDAAVEVASGVHALNPVFASNAMQFRHVGLRSMLRVLVYDRRSALDSRLLGAATLPAAAVPASGGPVYMWVPLSPPATWSKRRFGKLKGYVPWAPHGMDAARQQLSRRPAKGSQTGNASAFFSQQRQVPQVLLRIRVLKPATHNTTAAVQLNLEGLQLNAKSSGGDELLNLTVSTVQCAFLNTTRERQLSLSVLSVQLDNQLLETRHPVVMSPATMGEEVVVPAGNNDPRRILTTDKTLEDMDSPAQAMAAAVTHRASDNNRRSPAALAVAASTRQLQSAAANRGADSRKVALIRLSVWQTLTKPLTETGTGAGDEVLRPSSKNAADVAIAADPSSTGTADNAAASSFTAAAAGPRRPSSPAKDGASAVSSSTGSSSVMVAQASGSKSAVHKAAIVSFKKVELLMGALDLKTDQAFLEAVYIFVQSMPLADLWQDEAWKRHVAMLQGATSPAGPDNADTEQRAGAAMAAPTGLAARGSVLVPLNQGAASGTVPGSRQHTSFSTARLAQTLTLGSTTSSGFGSSQPATARHMGTHSAGTSWPQVLQQMDAGEQQQAAARGKIPAAASAVGTAAAAGAGSEAVPVHPSTAAAEAAAAKAGKRAAAAQRAALASALVLAWLPEKHDAELSSMKGQSSTWYYLEFFRISSLCVNVTIALTSSFRAAAGGPGAGSLGAGGIAAGADEGSSRQHGGGGSSGMLDEMQRMLVKGMVNRLSGDSGLQLINVSDVGLQLGAIELEGRLLNQVGLASHLYRHYRWAAVAQSRKVLGGVGPGLTQIPASILWAGVSMVDLGYEIVVARRSPWTLPFALAHVALTTFSQLVGVSSRFVIAMLALVPVERGGTLSDHAALQRYVRMPDTAGEAFYQAIAELYLGTAAGVAGLLLDPAAGLRLQGALGIAGVLAGILKGASGLMIRPVMGVLDASSKGLRGIGLLCLGRRGIQGKLVRRVRAPGALEGPSAGPSPTGAVAGRRGAADGRFWLDDAALHAALVASWQARLPALATELEGDAVMDVLATRSCRLLLLTRKHMLYLRASLPSQGKNAGTCSYSVRWLLPCDRVDHVRGAEESLRITLEYHSQLRAPDFKAWKQRLTAGVAGNAGKEAAKQTATAGAVEAGGSPQHLPLQGSRSADGSTQPVLLRVPLHHSLRCASPELYQQVIRAISRHLVQAEAAAAAQSAAAPAGPGLDATSAMQQPQQQHVGVVMYSSSGVVEGPQDVVEEEYADLYCVS